MSDKLTAKNVEAVFTDCLFNHETDAEPVLVDGVVHKFGLSRKRLDENAEKIKEMLADLPHQFHFDKGGGWSFLYACMTKDEEQWGEQATAEKLVVLGIATGQVKFHFPRDMWYMFPGGMPYFVVKPSENSLVNEKQSS